MTEAANGPSSAAVPAKPKPRETPAATPHHVDDKRDHALLDALKQLFSLKGGGGGTRQMGKNAKKATFWQLFQVVRRLVIIAAAIVYLSDSIQASIDSLRVLGGLRNAPMRFEAYETKYIGDYVGTGTIRESPLVMNVLANNTTPRNYTVFLEANGLIKVTNCSTPVFHARLYSTFFLRLAVGTLGRDTAFNNTILANYVIVAPIVDCSSTPIQRGDVTLTRVFYVMVRKTDPNDVILASVRFSMQDYMIEEQNERGSVGLSTFQIIRDMRASTVDTYVAAALGYPFDLAKFYACIPIGFTDEGWWILQSIPPNPAIEAPKRILTATRTGFYETSDTEQSNIKNLHWSMDDDPHTSIRKWNWRGEPVLRDSWAWVHLLHVGFAADMLFNLALLLLVIYRNMQKGKIWVGDAFVSVSTTLTIRGALILISWVLNGFWTLMEFCLADAHRLAQTHEVFFHPSIIRADLQTLSLGVVSLIGYIVRERIDPALVIFLFQIIFSARHDIAAWFPSTLAYIVEFAHMDHNLAVVGVSKTVALSSPMKMWTSHELPPKNVRFIFSCLLPIFTIGIWILAYVILRKIYHRIFQDAVYVQHSKDSKAASGPSSGTHKSEDERTITTFKRSLTLFEIATGAELQNRYGVVSDYENCLYIKGMKFASADGIYCNGYVVANGKHLIATADLPVIIMMKITRIRFQNLYMYEVDGNTVQQRARLVYPHSLTWSDLVHLNVTLLS